MKILSLAVTLFFVLDPFGNLPVVLGLLTHFDPPQQRRIVLRELLFSLIALVAAYAAGPWFLGMLDLTQQDLAICGGAVLGIIALRMVFPEDHGSLSRDTDTEPFIVPLAIPLIVGPSAVTTVMIMSAQSMSYPGQGLSMILIAWFASAVILYLGIVAGSHIPHRLLAALERLTGLLLSIIAVHMIMSGIQAYLMNLPKHG